MKLQQAYAVTNVHNDDIHVYVNMYTYDVLNAWRYFLFTTFLNVLPI